MDKTPHPRAGVPEEPSLLIATNPWQLRQRALFGEEQTGGQENEDSKARYSEDESDAIVLEVEVGLEAPVGEEIGDGREGEGLHCWFPFSFP